MKQGYGALKLADGTEYEGLWDHDAYHGIGRLQHQDGSGLFIGNFAKGRAQGFGSKKQENGTRYIGLWHLDK